MKSKGHRTRGLGELLIMYVDTDDCPSGRKERQRGPEGEKPSIGHFCLGVQNFEAERALKALTDQGVKARMRTRGESKEIFLTDPDNISVQLTDATYCGGSGPLGNKC